MRRVSRFKPVKVITKIVVKSDESNVVIFNPYFVLRVCFVLNTCKNTSRYINVGGLEMSCDV